MEGALCACLLPEISHRPPTSRDALTGRGDGVRGKGGGGCADEEEEGFNRNPHHSTGEVVEREKAVSEGAV